MPDLGCLPYLRLIDLAVRFYLSNFAKKLYEQGL